MNKSMQMWAALGLGALVLGGTELLAQASNMPSLSLNLGQIDSPDALSPTLKVIMLLTVLSVAPAILLMMSSFTRILIVLSFARQALGTQTMPPNQVLVGLSLFLTFFTMMPVTEEIKLKAFDPYMAKIISQDQALVALEKPMKAFMLKQTRESDLSMLYGLAEYEKPKSAQEVSFKVLLPAFLLSEIKTAFQMGFLIYIPFLVIDMVVSSVLMALGMMMLPPTVVSLPFKLVLFVLVDGWTLVSESLVKSFKLG